MGPISPGRWQVWHLFWRMGRTSLLYVTSAVPFEAGAANTAPADSIASRKPCFILVGASGRFFLGPHQIARIHFGVMSNGKEAEHHLFPTLIAVANFGFRVRIGGIVGRVIVMGNAFDARALG